jgi:hypothetical protein
MRELDIDRTGMNFTRNWFVKRNLATFREKVHPMFADKPITYLEIGVFEGQSFVWMLQHVLKHPDSRAVGIDPWLCTEKMNNVEMQGVKDRAHMNVAARVSNLPESYRFTKDGLPKDFLIQGNSNEVLRRMFGRKGFAGIKPGMLDLCMIDGAHNSLAVCDDARLVLQLLKPGGVMMFDDVENDVPKKDHVKEGIELFLQEAGNQVSLLWKDRHMEAYIKQ